MKYYNFYGGSLHKPLQTRTRFFFWLNFAAALVFALLLFVLIVLDWYVISSKGQNFFGP